MALTPSLASAADARREARWIVERAAGLDRAEWPSTADHLATVGGVARIDAMVARRRSGEPLQYVLGAWGFRRLDLYLDRRVLIPRPETEQVVEVALERVRRRPGPYLVADLGTGSGAIALALADELPVSGVEVWATDRSDEVLAVARANLAGIGRRAANVRLAAGDWYAALPADLAGRIDVVVSNPPYVATGDELAADVRDWEPPEALFAGCDGLDAIRVLLTGAPRWLRPGGWLVVEIGATQGETVRLLAAAAGLAEVEVLADLAGRDRILVARHGG